MYIEMTALDTANIIVNFILGSLLLKLHVSIGRVKRDRDPYFSIFQIFCSRGMCGLKNICAWKNINGWAM